jgi:hypothetical protein
MQGRRVRPLGYHSWFPALTLPTGSPWPPRAQLELSRRGASPLEGSDITALLGMIMQVINGSPRGAGCLARDRVPGYGQAHFPQTGTGGPR